MRGTAIKTLVTIIPLGIVLGAGKLIFSKKKEAGANMQDNTITKLGQNTSMGKVTLFVKDLEIVGDYYGNKIGLNILEKSNDSVRFGFGNTDIITLVKKDFSKSTYGAAGLYHTAILFPNRDTLALSLKSVLQKDPTSFEGSSDHTVSEAFYFRDPEGNGVELYVDRPRSEWKWQNGRVVMGSSYIDPVRFIEENTKNQSLEQSAKVGHVHLRVGDITKAKEFYVDTLGFDITAQLPEVNPMALFVSAGGYHHHLGLNIWESLGASKRTDSLGLGEFKINIENRSELENLSKNLALKGFDFNITDSTLTTQDPWNNKIIFSIQN